MPKTYSEELLDSFSAKRDNWAFMAQGKHVVGAELADRLWALSAAYSEAVIALQLIVAAHAALDKSENK